MTTDRDKIKMIEAKIKQGRARFDKMEASLIEKKRKERTSQLVAAGVLFQEAYKHFSQQTRQGWVSVARKNFSSNKHMLNRLVDMFDILNEDFPVKNSESPEKKQDSEYQKEAPQEEQIIIQT